MLGVRVMPPSKTSAEVMTLFRELVRGGITVILVTHEADIAGYASRVIVVKDGAIQSDVAQVPNLAAAPPREGAA